MPPPTDKSNDTSCRKTSATTHIAIANSPPRSRSTTNEVRKAIPPVTAIAMRHRGVALDTGVGEIQRRVGTDADERLLPDRDETAVPGEGVPHRRHEDEDPQPGQLLGDVGLEDGGDREQAEHDQRRSTAVRSSERRVQRSTRSARDGRHDRDARATKVRPLRTMRTARKTRFPNRIDDCGLICAPMVWATPSTIPPTSVPHSEPIPPMTTASNAKMSWVGPDERREARAHPEERAGDRDGPDRDRRRERVHVPGVDPDQLRRCRGPGPWRASIVRRPSWSGTAADRRAARSATRKMTTPRTGIVSWSVMPPAGRGQGTGIEATGCRA